MNVYNWLKIRSKAKIFIWGHSLGTGIGTHTISVLKTQNTTPAGLVLETPFTTIPDVMEYNFFIRVGIDDDNCHLFLNMFLANFMASVV